MYCRWWGTESEQPSPLPCGLPQVTRSGPVRPISSETPDTPPLPLPSLPSFKTVKWPYFPILTFLVRELWIGEWEELWVLHRPTVPSLVLWLVLVTSGFPISSRDWCRGAGFCVCMCKKCNPRRVYKPCLSSNTSSQDGDGTQERTRLWSRRDLSHRN